MVRYFCAVAVVCCLQFSATLKGQQANLSLTRTGPVNGAAVITDVNAIAPNTPFPESPDVENSDLSEVFAAASAGATQSEGSALAFASALGSASSLPAIGFNSFIPVVDSTYSIDLLASGDSAIAAVGRDMFVETEDAGASATGTYIVNGIGTGAEGLLNVFLYVAENGGSTTNGVYPDAYILVGDDFEDMWVRATVTVDGITYSVEGTLLNNENWSLATTLPDLEPTFDVVDGINHLFAFSVPISNGDEFTLEVDSALLNSALVATNADGAVAQLAWDLKASAWAVVTPLNAEPLPADFNGDGITDEADFFIWQDGFPTDFGGIFPEGDATLNGIIDEDDLDVWLLETVTSGVPGDYNSDGVVDLADYTVWRDTLGSTTDLRADGAARNGSQGIVDAEDYLVWKANFGFQIPGGLLSHGATTIPEPSAIAILALFGGCCVQLRRHVSWR